MSKTLLWRGTIQDIQDSKKERDVFIVATTLSQAVEIVEEVVAVDEKIKQVILHSEECYHV